MGRQRSALRGLGDLSPERIARRSEPHLRLAVERLVWTGRFNDPTTAARPGRPSATSSSTTASRARISGTTARRIRGNSSASGTSSRRSPIPIRSMPASKTRRFFARPTAARRGMSCQVCEAHGSGPRWQPGAGGMCLHTIILDPTNPDANLHRDFRRRCVPDRRRRRDVAADQSRSALRAHSGPDCRSRPLRAPHRDAPVAARTCSSCRSTGT